MQSLFDLAFPWFMACTYVSVNHYNFFTAYIQKPFHHKTWSPANLYLSNTEIRIKSTVLDINQLTNHYHRYKHTYGGGEYIGKNVDDVFIPNKRYLLQQELEAAKASVKPGPVLATECKRVFYGATYLLDEIDKKIGVTQDLKNCFPEDYKKILSIAYYLVLEANSAIYRFHRWSKIHKHPYGRDIPSQRSSELFRRITENAKLSFFTKQS